MYNVFEQDSSNQDVTQPSYVNGLGFYSTGSASDSGFYVDQVSFSSEKREFHSQNVGYAFFKVLACIIV